MSTSSIPQSTAVDRQRALADSGLLRSPGKQAAKGAVTKSFKGGFFGSILGAVVAGLLASKQFKTSGVGTAGFAIGGGVAGGLLGSFIGMLTGARHGYTEQRSRNEALSGLVG